MRALCKVLLLVLLASSGVQIANGQTASDTFTRANSGTLGSNWTSVSNSLDTLTLGITSNAAELQSTSTTQRGSAYWSATTFPPNQYSKVIGNGSATGTNSHLAGVIVRATSNSYYGFTWNLYDIAAGFSVFKNVNGAFTSLATADSTGTALGSTIALQVVGSQLTAFVNGVQILSVYDTDLTSGSPGITSYQAAATPTVYMTNWAGGAADVGLNVANTWSAIQTFSSGSANGGPITSTAAAPWIWTGPAGSCGTQPSVTSTSGSSLCLGDSNGAVNASTNGDAWLPVTRTVKNGTSTFATTSIGAGACSAVVSPSVPAVASTDTIKWSYQTQPTAGTDAALDMQTWVTAGTGINFKRCNNTGASINPTAIVINWEITR